MQYVPTYLPTYLTLVTVVTVDTVRSDSGDSSDSSDSSEWWENHATFAYTKKSCIFIFFN